MTAFQANSSASQLHHAFASREAASRARWARLGKAVMILTTVVAAGRMGQLRYAMAAKTPWQCDEIPLLVRFTGLCGHVTNERQARTFVPSYYTAYMGALRSLKAPTFYATLHTTAGFWTNLTVHLFGVNPLAGRLMPMLWSMIAVIAAAAAAYLATRSAIAMCVAALIVTLSPHGVAYGAQARGYAEAMALTPLMLIALEGWRRKPVGLWRAAAVALLSLQLALTVYTVWVYWVWPVLIIALFLPNTIADRRSRTSARAVITVIVIGTLALMSLFTIDRWSQLTRQAAVMGAPLNGWEDGARFLGLLGNHLFFEPVPVALLAWVGAVVAWRTQVRWWVIATGAGVVVPALFALGNGSAGYPRNFGYLIGPLAMLAGIGIHAIYPSLARRFRPLPVGVASLLILVGATAWACADVPRRARAILLPDWGDVVMSLDRRPTRAGPRWFCHDLANHWQIDWYREPMDYDRFLEVAEGGEIEVAFGAQLSERGLPTVFRHDPVTRTIPQDPLPAYLAAVPPTLVRSGIEVRQWIGRASPLSALRDQPPDDPVFILFPEKTPIGNEALCSFLVKTDARRRGLVGFKPVRGRNGLIRSMMAPSAMLSDLSCSMRDELKVDPATVRWFRLLPFPTRQAPSADRPEEMNVDEAYPVVQIRFGASGNRVRREPQA